MKLNPNRHSQVSDFKFRLKLIGRSHSGILDSLHSLNNLTDRSDVEFCRIVLIWVTNWAGFFREKEREGERERERERERVVQKCKL